MQRLQAMKEGAWQGRSGTMETGGNVTSSSFGAMTTSSSLEQLPPSLRLKKKNTELPPLSNATERVHSAPQVLS